MNKKLTALLIMVFIPAFFLIGKVFAADYYPASTSLQYGVQSSKVAGLQEDLRALGYLDRAPTGYFGNITKSSVMEYQKDNFLAADGVVGPSTAKELKNDVVVASSKEYRGIPYVWGGTSPSGFDCSGFTQYVFQKNNVALARTAADQFSSGAWVARGGLKPGDLVFFSTYKPGPSHVGIYIGNNKFIQASTSQGVTITDLSNPYFSPRYIGAKRII